ncbi:hypothetical protein [Hymenobacter negativus]|nr:hypothetical protein [Hymenobacter negativus]
MLATPMVRAQTAPTWASVRRLPAATSVGQSRAESIALATDGSQYVVGRFTGTLVLGNITLTEGAGSGHLYLAKYSAAGVALWATKLDANGSSVHAKVAVDAAGNAYLAGDFDTFLTLGSTTLTATTVAGTPNDAFLVKYDSQGVQQWVRQAVAGGAGNTGSAFLYGVATDASGNVTIAGDFLNSVSFGGTPFTGAGVYLYRFSPTGTLLLSKQVSDDGFADDLVLDAAGNAYITGGFYNNTTFGTTTLPNAGNADLFLCKLNAAGTLQWVQTAGGPDEDAGTALALDAAGNAVVCGYYGNAKYLVRVTNQGALGWTRVLASGSLGYSPFNAVVYDGRGGFFVAGRFSGSLILGNTTLTATGLSACVARYDGQGTAVWASQAVSTGTPAGSGADGLATDAAGTIYLAGYALSSTQFGSLPVSTGGSDALVATLTAGSVLATHAASPALALAAYPNPASGRVTLTLPVGGGQLELLDALGRRVRQLALPATAGPCAVPLAGLAPGLYQLRATLGNGQPAQATLQVQ